MFSSNLLLLTQRCTGFNSVGSILTTSRRTFLASSHLRGSDKYYAKSHEWLESDDSGTGTIGISDHAQDELGDIVFVSLPEAGASIEAGDEVVEVESVKAVGNVYAPATGTVTEINEELANSPDLINSAPETDGWLFKMQVTEKADGLMSEGDYKEYLAQLSDDD
mmetsp:Transcript_4028/g.6037  ORF Transcript_4028/g.6037 Transcript_4028/m.6037 type:complete len:165 (-) Transcript_4028:53-547(-)|eukprot:CAMPEP_0201544524 /NCGR_PEP_ID=MMETSP0173_2-20130828/1157_1 /ASSEMBLY_ACC=CAM_ASM_000268 /TAXON_ID=218659 /ORGANISM="Vexillifera sp., Strain DIVA3 564/2" /LENGTH=164 /DNA_ID=CAMNT_0047952671 /DNA_START=40 /DNA_END=534 /DNA_ORIENTATION=+